MIYSHICGDGHALVLFPLFFIIISGFCGSSASFHISSLPGAFLNVLRARQGTKLHEVKMYSAQKSSFGMGKKEVGMSCDRAHMAYRTHSRHIGGTQKVYQHAAWHTL